MRDRNPVVDRLRGISIFAAVAMHYTMFFPNIFGFTGCFIGNGYYGVICFFAISGFLIADKLMTDGQLSRGSGLIDFYIQRAGRVFPNLAVLILFLSVMSRSGIAGFAFPDDVSLTRSIHTVLTLRYNQYFVQGGLKVLAWAPLWSLMIEEMFYLFFPIVLLLTRQRLAPVIALLMVLCIVGPLDRSAGIVSYYQYFGCFDSIAFGILAAIASKHVARQLGHRSAWVLLGAGCVIVAAMFLGTDCRAWVQFGPTCVAAGTALVLVASRAPTFAKAKRYPDPLAMVGALSYELYLFHMAAFAIAARILKACPIADATLIFLVVGGATVLVSLLLHRYYARPANHAIRRLRFRMQSRGEVAAQTA